MKVKSAFSILFSEKGDEFIKAWMDVYKYEPLEYPEIVELPRKNFICWRQSEVWYGSET